MKLKLTLLLAALAALCLRADDQYYQQSNGGAFTGTSTNTDGSSIQTIYEYWDGDHYRYQHLLDWFDFGHRPPDHNATDVTCTTYTWNQKTVVWTNIETWLPSPPNIPTTNVLGVNWIVDQLYTAPSYEKTQGFVYYNNTNIGSAGHFSVDHRGKIVDTDPPGFYNVTILIHLWVCSPDNNQDDIMSVHESPSFSDPPGHWTFGGRPSVKVGAYTYRVNIYNFLGGGTIDITPAPLDVPWPNWIGWSLYNFHSVRQPIQ